MVQSFASVWLPPRSWIIKCLAQHIIATLAPLAKGRERMWAHKSARERTIQKCAFSFLLSPCLHHTFCHLLWLLSLPFAYLYHALYHSIQICHVFDHLLPCTYFTAWFPCSTYSFTLTLDFFFNQVHKTMSPLCHLLCHMYFTFTLTMPHGIVDIPT